jgi:hypothetical protein
MSWTTWNTGLDNDHETLGKIYASLPGFDQSDISPLVQLLENPQSPVAFTGSIDLFGHDCIHILLGRGLLAQDEAFVIGFTMGTSKTIGRLQRALFKFAARFLYPSIYRFSTDDCKIFELGIEAGKLSQCSEIYKANFRSFLSEPVGKIRATLGIDAEFLQRIYAEEAILLPNTVVSARLPKQQSEPEHTLYTPKPYLPKPQGAIPASMVAA